MRLVDRIRAVFVPQKTKLPTVQGLRGVAALAVCWFHFSGLSEFQNILLGRSGHYGYLGVDVFFVISGFIVPYSMFTAGYQIKNIGIFLIKRIIRVEPPYLFSIVLALLFGYFSTWSSLYRGGPQQVSATQLALHLGYLIPFFPNYEWLSVVYWTLAIEFQFYLVLSIAFPLFFSRKPAIRILSCLAFAASSLFVSPLKFLPAFAPLFVFGFVGMMRLAGWISWKEFCVTVAVCVALAYRSTGIYATAAALSALLVILFVKRLPALFLWLGDVSYSLYLIHETIGRRFLHVTTQIVPLGYRSVLPFFAVALSLICALMMFRLIELPAKRMAGSWKYNLRNSASTNEDQAALASV